MADAIKSDIQSYVLGISTTYCTQYSHSILYTLLTTMMIIASFFLSLFATLTACQSGAMAASGGGDNSPIIGKETTSPIQRFLEQRRLQQEANCTRTDYLGQISTVCTQPSGIESSCTVSTDGNCSYYAVNVNDFEQAMASLSNSTTSTSGVGSDGNVTYDEIYDDLFYGIVAYLSSESLCDCADATPNCTMTNLTNYTFNACAAEPEYNYNCKIDDVEDGASCCDVVDAQGKMRFCQSQTDTILDTECYAGSNTGTMILSNSTCEAAFNGKKCSCDFCYSGSLASPIVSYDCTSVGGSKRDCPVLDREEDQFGIMNSLLAGNIPSFVKYIIVDPRVESDSGSEGTDSGVSNGGIISTVAFAISSLVAAALLD
eukprot:scaffold2441_cov105-Cylindrotheca_fusiformis.AAC.3